MDEVTFRIIESELQDLDYKNFGIKFSYPVAKIESKKQIISVTWDNLYCLVTLFHPCNQLIEEYGELGKEYNIHHHLLRSPEDSLYTSVIGKMP
jgi:hypothetical protein